MYPFNYGLHIFVIGYKSTYIKIRKMKVIKIIILSILISIPLLGYSQEIQKRDTIYRDNIMIERIVIEKEIALVEPLVYRIKRGDTIQSVAKSNGITVSELCRWNSLTSKTILRYGKTLVIGYCVVDSF